LLNILKKFSFRCVTGASKGIGAEICLKLANDGDIVIGLARSVEKIIELNEQVKSDSVGKIVGRKCDVTNESDIVAAFSCVISKNS